VWRLHALALAWLAAHSLLNPAATPVRVHGWLSVCLSDAVCDTQFYRTDTRKGTTEQEFTAWSPTLVQPPAFHVPEYFGVLELR
jgi:hypothetical protein